MAADELATICEAIIHPFKGGERMPETGHDRTLPTRCVICGDTPTVRSHLLPRAFAHDLRGEGKNLWIAQVEGLEIKFSQSGSVAYFLCQTHEEATQCADAFAVKFVRDFILSPREVEARSFQRDGPVNEVLVRFVCSVLWRFHQAKLPETALVDVGEWEPNLRDVTFGGSTNQAPDILIGAIHQTFISKAAFIHTPAPIKYCGRRAFRFTLSGLFFIAKIEHEDWPPIVQPFVLDRMPDRMVGPVAVWGEAERQMMNSAAASMRQKPAVMSVRRSKPK